jgi:hypothetical protein
MEPREDGSHILRLVNPMDDRRDIALVLTYLLEVQAVR